MEEVKDLSVNIYTDKKRREYIHVDEFDDDIWFRCQVRQASVHLVMTKESAKELIDALQALVDA